MPVAEATALAAGSARDAALRLERYDPAAARTALVALAAQCEQFSPLVGLEVAERPESLLLDVTGLAPLFGSEQALVERVVRWSQTAGWQVRLALADTIGAAWALAHYAPADSFLLAGTGTIVAPGESLPAVAQLPIAALRVDDQQAQLLRELGLEQIGQLEALPRSALAARFGPELLRRWDQLTGVAEETIRSERRAPQLTASWSCEEPIVHTAVIAAVIARLLEQLTVPLAGQQRGVLQLACRLRGARQADTEFSLGLFRPTAAPAYLSELVQMRLERLRLTEPVTKIEVVITSTELLECRQREFFESHTTRDNPRELAALVDRLSSRLGRENVLRARLSSDAQPERAWRYEPLVGWEPAPRAASPGKQNRLRERYQQRSLFAPPSGEEKSRVDGRHFKWSQRPLRLAPRPVPLTVTAVVPDGPLLWFLLAGQQRHITRSWGPERIETGWWRGRSVRRDYYRVETTDGHRYWLFRRLRDGNWFWHGAFD